MGTGPWIRALAAGAALAALAPAALERAAAPQHPLDATRIAAAARAAAPDAPPLAAAHTYRVSLTLAVDPAAPAAQAWDARRAIDRHLQPLLDRLASLAHVEVDSQILHFSRLVPGSDLQHVPNPIRPHHLAAFTSANDWNAQSASLSAHRHTTVHLMAFLPAALPPPALVDADGRPTDAFIVPRWGGVVVLPHAASDHGWLSADQLAPAFHRFAAQLSHLLDLTPLNGTASEPPPADQARWLTQFVAKAGSTLQALANLANNAAEMTLLDRVHDQVDRCLALLDRIAADCQQLESLAPPLRRRCLADARDAFEAADLAFFDPSLLPQLYFPPEHFLAVYLPFLLPALLPVLTAVAAALKGLLLRRSLDDA